MVAIVPILLASLVAGMVLLILGLRGRRVNSHPACASCEFDLQGLVSPNRCPECGKDLSKPDAVRTGVRVRRPRLATIGGLLILIALLGGGSWVAAFLGGARVHKVTPTLILFLETRVRSDVGLAEVLSELLDRDMKGALSPGQRTELAAVAFRLQQNPRTEFPRSAAAMLEDATLLQLLSKPQRDVALATGAYPELVARTSVRSGQPVPIRLGLAVSDRFIRPGLRAAGCSTLIVRVLDSNGHEVAKREHPVVGTLPTYAPPGGGTRSGASSYLLSVPLQLAPGRYTLESNITLYLTDRGRNYPFTPTADDIPVPVKSSTILDVGPADKSTIRLVENEDARARVNSILQLSLHTSPYSATQTWISVGMSVSIDTRGQLLTPVGTDGGGGELMVSGVYRVFAERLNADGSGDARSIIPMGQCILRYHSGTWMFHPPGAAVDGGPPKGKYRLVFVPDPEYAESQVDYDEILDGRLVFENIEIR